MNLFHMFSQHLAKFQKIVEQCDMSTLTEIICLMTNLLILLNVQVVKW